MRNVFSLIFALALSGCSITPRHPEQREGSRVEKALHSVASDEKIDEPTIVDMAKQIAALLGKQGELKDDVYTVTFPRTDLEVSIEGMDVPTAAGVASEFRFYRCPCGKAVLIGQFVVADYEANDVVDSLHKGGLKVASMGPFLLHEQPRLMLIRFQGEGKTESLARTVREALSWTGDERMAPQKPIDEAP